DQAITEADFNYYRVTARMMRTVFVEIKANVAFNRHFKIVALLEQNGVDMGDHHRDDQFTSKTTKFLGNHMHEALLRRVKAEKPPVGIIVDGRTAPSQEHQICYLVS